MSSKQLPPATNSSKSNSNKASKNYGGYSNEPLLQTTPQGQGPLRRRSSLDTLDKELKQWDEQYADMKYFYGAVTALFFASAIFARLTDLYSRNPTGPLPVGKVLSSYVVFVPLAFVLRAVARVGFLIVVSGGIVVGLFWSIIQEISGRDVDLSVDSMSCCWSWYHFLIFGLVGAAAVWGIKFRYEEVKDGSWKWSEARDVVWAAVGVVMIVIGTLAGASIHIHSWFFGFALTLAADGLGGPPGFSVRAFGFGLFMQGAACWGMGDLFQETVVTTTTLSPNEEEGMGFMPFLLLAAVVGAFWGAKYKKMI